MDLKPVGRGLSDCRSEGRKSSLSDCSMDNATNFNWQTGYPAAGQKRKEGSIRVAGEQTISLVEKTGVVGEGVLLTELLQNSQYCIDELGPEFCQKSQDGWLKFQPNPGLADEESESKLFQTSPEGSSTLEGPEGQPRTGRWSKEEHQRFLQGLKLYGKDWNKLQQHVRTRSIQSLTSHSQKFLQRLIAFLEKQQGFSFDEMTIDEAEFFFGILNQRQSWAARIKRENLARKEQSKAKGDLFAVVKTWHRGPAAQPISPKAVDSKCEESYSRWKQNLLKGQGGDNRSKGFEFSIKVKRPPSSRGFEFKSDLQVLNHDPDNESSDSGTSQSHRHFRQFWVDDLKYDFVDEEVFKTYTAKLLSACKALPDIEPDDTDFKIMIRFQSPELGQREFEVLTNPPMSYLLSSLVRQEEWLEELSQLHPNLSKYLTGLYSQKMEDELMDADTCYPVMNYLHSLSKEEIRFLIRGEITYFYLKTGSASEAHADDPMETTPLFLNVNQSEASAGQLQNLKDLNQPLHEGQQARPL